MMSSQVPYSDRSWGLGDRHDVGAGERCGGKGIHILTFSPVACDGHDLLVLEAEGSREPPCHRRRGLHRTRHGPFPMRSGSGCLAATFRLGPSDFRGGRFLTDSHVTAKGMRAKQQPTGYAWLI